MTELLGSGRGLVRQDYPEGRLPHHCRGFRKEDIQVRRVEKESNATPNDNVAIFLRLPCKPKARTYARINRRIYRVDPCPLKDNASFIGIEDRQILIAIVQRAFVIIADAVVQVELVRQLPCVLAKERERVDKYLSLRISASDSALL